MCMFTKKIVIVLAEAHEKRYISHREKKKRPELKIVSDATDLTSVGDTTSVTQISQNSG